MALRVLLNSRATMERLGTSDRLILSALLRTMDLRIDDRRELSYDQITEFSRF
ncbi:hypothetical protein [Arthrobacter rhombi]|uniref:hypothetical protein n=1 Tax=Arthrobacter rhombi TaxID=71253 RepID=UPI003FCEEDFD